MIELHVDELVLDGFPGADAGAVAEAVRGELALLLGRRVPRLAAAESLDAGPVAAPQRGGEAAFGAEVGRAVYGGLAR